MQVLFQHLPLQQRLKQTPQPRTTNVLPSRTNGVLFTGHHRKVGNPHQTVLGKPFFNAMGQLVETYQQKPPRHVLAEAMSSASLMLEYFATADQTVASVLYTLRRHQPETMTPQAIQKQYGAEIAGWIAEADAFDAGTETSLSQPAAMMVASRHLVALERQNLIADLETVEHHHQILNKVVPFLPASYAELVPKLKPLMTKPLPFSVAPLPSAVDEIALTPDFLKALTWALKLHRKQSRNAMGTPYASHLLDVAAQVALHGGSETAVIAALFHDGPEDQGGETIRRFLKKHFSEAAADIIQDLTQPDTRDWYTNKRGYIGHIPHMKNSESPLTMAADKYHNLKSILHVALLRGAQIWKTFTKGQNEQLWFYQRVLQALENKTTGNALIHITENILQQLKSMSFNEDARTHVQKILARVPQYQDLTQLVESLPPTCYKAKTTDKPAETICPANRGALHQKILGRLYSEFMAGNPDPTAPKVAHVVTGMMGSGKTSMVVNRLPDQHNLFVVDSDRIKEMIPEYHLPKDDPRLLGIPGIDQLQIPETNGLGATAVHQESSYLMAKLLEDVIQKGHSFVVSHTGRDITYDIGFMKNLKAQGYKVYLHHIEVPPNMAIDRAMNRFHTVGRFPPPKYVGSIGGLSTENYLTLRDMGVKEGFIDGHSWSYNGVPDGEAPIDIERVNC